MGYYPIREVVKKQPEPSSEHGRKGAQRSFGETLAKGTVGKFRGINFVAVRKIDPQDLRQGAVVLVRTEKNVELEIQAHRAVIQVGRADHRPLIVRDGHFGVMSPRRVFVDLYASPQQL